MAATPSPATRHQTTVDNDGPPVELHEDEASVASGPGEPAQAHLVEDPYTGVRVVHEELVDPASTTDRRLIPPQPSVWEAVEDAEGQGQDSPFRHSSAIGRAP